MILSPSDIARCEQICSKRRGEVAEIVREVSTATGVSTAAIYGRARTDLVAGARQLVMYVAYRQGVSGPAIAYALGRDHTTVYAGIKAEKTRRGEA